MLNNTILNYTTDSNSTSYENSSSSVLIVTETSKVLIITIVVVVVGVSLFVLMGLCALMYMLISKKVWKKKHKFKTTKNRFSKRYNNIEMKTKEGSNKSGSSKYEGPATKAINEKYRGPEVGEIYVVGDETDEDIHVTIKEEKELK